MSNINLNLLLSISHRLQLQYIRESTSTMGDIATTKQVHCIGFSSNASPCHSFAQTRSLLHIRKILPVDMRVSWINLVVVFGALCGCGSVSGSTHDGKLVNKHRHIDPALAARDDANSTVSLAKRTFENARFSTFTPGPSACGGYNNANQPVSAYRLVPE